MGHYDDCYEFERNEEAKKENEHLNNEMGKKWKKLSNHEKKIVLLATENISVLKGFANFLNQVKKA